MKSKELDILKFLEHYRRYPCLWEKSSSPYKNRQMRDEAERFLMEISGIENVKVLRAKIRSIRGTYNNEIRKIRKSTIAGSGTKDVYSPKLHWFNYANSFLSKNIEDEPDFETNLEIFSQCQSDDGKYINHKKRAADVFNGEPLCPPTSSSPSTTASSAKASSILSVENSTATKVNINPCKMDRTKKCHKSANANSKKYESCQTKIRKKSKIGDVLREAIVTLKHATNNINNEFLTFGQSVGVQLSKLPLRTAMQMQYDIQGLLTAARISVLPETTKRTQPTNLHSPGHSISSSCPSPVSTPFQVETVNPSQLVLVNMAHPEELNEL